MDNLSRRQILRLGGGASISSLAGCSIPLLSDSTKGNGQSFERLHLTAVYVAEGVDLSIPEEVQTVSQPYNAELLILPDETTVAPEHVVEWFAADRIIALLGANAEATWLDWAQTDAVTQHFKNDGVGDAEPDPSLVVAANIDLYLKTYRHSWGSEPRDRDVLQALDEKLVAIANETPPD